MGTTTPFSLILSQNPEISERRRVLYCTRRNSRSPRTHLYNPESIRRRGIAALCGEARGLHRIIRFPRPASASVNGAAGCSFILTDHALFFFLGFHEPRTQLFKQMKHRAGLTSMRSSAKAVLRSVFCATDSTLSVLLYVTSSPLRRPPCPATRRRGRSSKRARRSAPRQGICRFRSVSGCRARRSRRS